MSGSHNHLFENDVDKLVGRCQELGGECSRAWGESDAKIGLVVMLLILTARLEGNKRSDDGCNEDGMMQLLVIGIC